MRAHSKNPPPGSFACASLTRCRVRKAHYTLTQHVHNTHPPHLIRTLVFPFPCGSGHPLSYLVLHAVGPVGVGQVLGAEQLSAKRRSVGDFVCPGALGAETSDIVPAIPGRAVEGGDLVGGKFVGRKFGASLSVVLFQHVCSSTGLWS
jgi:hypothetical protein